MHWRRGLAALLVMLALAGCAEGAISQGQTHNSPYSPENHLDMRDSDGGGM
jgi:hypothetical protein